jgi:hypothetical protein
MEAQIMSSGMSSWRMRRQAARTRRAFGQALESANTPAMQQELLTLASSRPFTNVPR